MLSFLVFSRTAHLYLLLAPVVNPSHGVCALHEMWLRCAAYVYNMYRGPVHVIHDVILSITLLNRSRRVFLSA